MMRPSDDNMTNPLFFPKLKKKSTGNDMMRPRDDSMTFK